MKASGIEGGCGREGGTSAVNEKGGGKTGGDDWDPPSGAHLLLGRSRLLILDLVRLLQRAVCGILRGGKGGIEGGNEEGRTRGKAGRTRTVHQTLMKV